MGNIIAEIFQYLYILITIFTSVVYLRYLEKTRKQRALSTFEWTMYIMINAGYLFLAISILISVFS